ncbi:porin family protein [Pontibacter arcticus]|uniref:PorT family protein n=1 Tax=Pontibacter arcticus TaxID=2080288 RepID=A0A364RB35_9BACT|nr:porin family protein [Pontibacter arcticus]RAU81465.1 PorT family protein [Pontibacter arcticus]
MKKSLFLVLFAFLTTVAAQAQMAAPTFGVRVGANYSGFSGDDVNDDMERQFGFHGGLTANFPLTDDGFLSLQPEVLYSMKGSKFEFNNGDFKTKLSYIDVPVLARINAGPLYFEGGPQFSYRIGGEQENTVGSVTVTNDDLDQYRKTAFGYAAGVGIGTPMGVSIGVRYNGDFTKLNDADNDADAPEIRNSVFMLTLAYSFGAR